MTLFLIMKLHKRTELPFLYDSYFPFWKPCGCMLFYGRYQDLIEKYQRSVNVMVNDSFPGYFLFDMKRNLVLILLFTFICRLDLSLGFVCT